MADELGFLVDDNDLFVDFDLSLFTETPMGGGSPPDSWMGEIESQLMKDEDNQNLDQQSVSEFLADIFVDDPTSEDSVDMVTGKIDDDVPTVDVEGSDDAAELKRNDSGSENQDEAKDDDAMAKKRTRRVRNRDAAVRSRERKKEYVTDVSIWKENA